MPNPSFDLTLDDLECLATGAWILGTGGGGDPYFSLLEAREHLAAGKRARIIDPLSLADDALIACVGQMGAPLVKQERLVDGPVIASTVTMMEDYLKKSFEAVMLWEIGGNNGFQAVLTGMLLDLPIVDCDAMGRAFPQADMTTFSICELPAYPWTMVDLRKNRIFFAEAENWEWMERMTRAACTAIGSSAATCKAPRSGAEVKSSTCLHTVSQALRIGRAVRDARRRHDDPVAAVIESENGLELFRGKITDVNRRTTGGWLRGTIEIDGLDADTGSTMKIEFQNEFVVAWRDDAVSATVPDLICLMDTSSGEAIGTETVRYGQRVTVIALPAPDILTSPRGLKKVGPRAFGYDLEFKSVFSNAPQMETAQ
ncbi:DUF917 domain-containing protein [Acuticoccus kandeliae]|uniref:DUF917 domain-containing protein n=1 Tax=Acuticoccus kandeliae TaxID=2073160 RepID=UPI000D3E6D5E|nr:DUF917 domain-containing protein [Acuticoccus kandeliae]